MAIAEQPCDVGVRVGKLFSELVDSLQGVHSFTGWVHIDVQ
ncbi:hypothetical protein I546_5173 [Mycobacterium kansasii 732]|nr:hypothetical protein I546_5173 [Mycobacterium kansasii 732]